MTGKSRGASNLKNTICRHDAYLDGFFWQNAWSSRFKKLALFTKYRSFWFKAKTTRSFWFKGEKVMELLLYLGVASVQQWVPICKNVHVVRPQTLGALGLKRRILSIFLGASGLKSEKYQFSQCFLAKSLSFLGASVLTSFFCRF